jgi:outer membrane receptor protein involved in Fe transport
MKNRNRLEAIGRFNAALNLGAVILGATLAAPSGAQEPADPDERRYTEEVIVTTGRGETRQVQTVLADQIAQLPPGTSALKAIEHLPGVNFQSADPYGVRVVDAHHGARLQPEPHGLHARPRSARRYDVR